jgi:peptidoglycan/LPS O-acetylase OafA/YrhL
MAQINNSKKTNIIYWIVTGLFAFIMFGSAIPDVLMADMARKGFAEIQMPAYLLPFVGIAKMLGVLVILIPGNLRLKEWAYAGLIFDLIGATYAVAASGKTIENWAPMFIFIALGFASYFYYHQRLREKPLLIRS